MASEKFSTSTRRISNEDVAAAVKQAAAGKFKGMNVEWRSKSEPALVLRMRAMKVSWLLRYRSKTVTLKVPIETDVGVIEMGAHLARLMLGEGGDPSLALRNFEELVRDTTGQPEQFTLISVRVLEILPSNGGEKVNTWTWGEGVEAFLAMKRKKLKEPWRTEYEKTLRLPPFQKLWNVPLASLDIGQLDDVRDAIAELRGESTVYRAVQQSKAMLDWSWKYKAKASGLTTQYDWWRRWSVDYTPKRRRRKPTIREVARTLLLAERHRSLSEREHATGPGALGALWAVALTAQRASQIVGMRADRMFVYDDVQADARSPRPHPTGLSFDDGLPGDWRIYNWTLNEMKASQGDELPHALPLPPEAVSILLSFQNLEGPRKTPFLFPSAKSCSSITKSGLNILLYRLDGRRQQGTRTSKAKKPRPPKVQRPPRPSLFEIHNIRYWSPHDVRRTLTTFLRDRRLGGAASAILGHRDDRDSRDADNDRMNEVTEIHYNQSQQIGLKAEGMKLWVDALLSAYREEVMLFDKEFPAEVSV